MAYIVRAMQTNGTNPDVLMARFRQEVEAEQYLTQAEVAEEIGVSLRALSRYMNTPGLVPKKTTLKKVRAWLETRT